MDLQTVIAAAGFAVASTWTPGPNNMMLAASGATFGYRMTLPHAFGVALGFPLMLFLIALGLGEVFQRSPGFRSALLWLGFAVMLWLAWRIGTANAAGSGTSRSRPLSFFEASAFQWINPKAWVMAIGAAATYATGLAPLTEAALLALIFVISGIGSSQAWTAFGSMIGRVLGTGLRLRIFNGAMGGLVALSALYLVLDGT